MMGWDPRDPEEGEVRCLVGTARTGGAGPSRIGGASAISIAPEAVTFTDAAGATQQIRADHVIVAMGATGDNTLADHLRAAGFAVETVGDCNGVGYIEGAVRGGAEAAQRLLA